MNNPVLLIATFAIVLGIGAAARGQVAEPMVLSQPKVSVPQEAKESGVGGVIAVKVEVDAAGRVTAIKGVTGPGWVCPQVMRADVVALREVASAAAIKATFEPAVENGVPVASTGEVRFKFKGSETEAQPLPFGAALDERPSASTGGSPRTNDQGGTHPPPAGPDKT